MDPCHEDVIHIGLTSQPLDIAAITQSVTRPRGGAISTFLGTTRDSFEGKEVIALEYEAYDAMALKEMRKIALGVFERYGGRESITAVAISHRIGLVPIGESSVIIAVGSVHRKPGLEACAWAIDELKATVPIFKKEVYADGSMWKQNQEFTVRRQLQP